MAALLSRAVQQLDAAGIDNARGDARLLLAHVVGCDPGRLFLLDSVSADQLDDFQRLLGQRAGRVPLQHLTGVAYFRYEQLEVGPGVFVPRPETEVMTGWAVEQLRRMCAAGRSPLVVELCAGSGAISRSLAHEVPGAVVHAVELSEEAARYAATNLAGTSVTLHVQDMATALPELDGSVDLVIANPPYVPLDAYLSVSAEARDHDPTLSLFSGADGLDALRVVAEVAGRLLVGGGLVCAEHAEVQAESAPAVFVSSGSFGSVRDHRDLAERPRYLTAVRRFAVGSGPGRVWQDGPRE